MGEPLAKLFLFDSVSGTDTTSTKEKNLSGGTLFKIPVVIFSYAAFVGLPKEANSVQLDHIFVIRQDLKGKR